MPESIAIPFLRFQREIFLMETESQRHEQPKNIFNLKTTDICVKEEVDKIGPDSHSHSYKQIGLNSIAGFAHKTFDQAVADHSKEPHYDY